MENAKDSQPPVFTPWLPQACAKRAEVLCGACSAASGGGSVGSEPWLRQQVAEGKEAIPSDTSFVRGLSEGRTLRESH